MRRDYPKSLYSFEVWDSSGLVAYLDKALSRHLTAIRNRPGTASFILSKDDPKATREILKPGINEIRVRRGQKYIWGGQISRVEAILEGASGTVALTAAGFLDLFKDRFTAAARVFTNTDAGTIAWTLLEESQKTAGNYDPVKDFGVRAGTIQASVNRTRTYEFKEIKDAVIQLSEVINGFDFEIDHEKKFHVFYPKQGQLKPELVLRYPGTIGRLVLPIDASQMANQVIARGSGLGASQPIVQRDQTGVQAAYRIRQRIVDYPDVIEDATLEQHADEILRVESVPYEIPEIELLPNTDPHIKDFWLGDVIRVKASQGLVQIDNDYRIDQIDVEVDENDLETVKLKVGLG